MEHTNRNDSFVLDKLGQLAGSRFAVLIDEAHSSQSGESAKKMKEVSGAAVDETKMVSASSRTTGARVADVSVEMAGVTTGRS